MATVIDSLLIQLGIDTTTGEIGLDKFNDKIRNAGVYAKRAFAGIARAAAWVTAGAGAAFYLLNKRIDEAIQSSNKIGTTIEKFEQFRLAVRAAGYNVEFMVGVFDNLYRRIASAATGGNSQFLEMMNSIGISAKDANGNIKSSIDLIKELAAAVPKYGVDSVTRVATGLGIDGKAIGLIIKDSEKFLSLLDEYEGKGITEHDAENFKNYQKELGDVVQVFDKWVLLVSRKLYPVISSFLEKTEKGLKYIEKHIAFFLPLLISMIGMLGIAFAIMMKKIIVMTAMFIGISSPILLIIGVIAAALVGISLLIEDFYVYLDGGEAKFSKIYDWIIKWYNALKELFSGYLFPAWGVFLDAVEKGLDLIVALFSLNFKEAWEIFKEIWGGLGEFLIQLVSDWFNFLLSKVKEFGSMLASTIKENAGDLFSGGMKVVGETISNATPFGAAISAAKSGTSVNTNNNQQTTTVTGTTINVNAPNSDPKAIASAAGSEMRKLANQSNKGVRQ